MNTEEIMKLADAYANQLLRSGQGVLAAEARAALEAALTAKLGEQEPSARLMTWIGKGTYPEKGYTIARTYKECGKDAYPNDWKEGAPLFTHPAPVNRSSTAALLTIWWLAFRGH